MSNTDETAGWFDEAGREGSPSAKFKEVGDSVKGEVVDKYKIDYVPFGKKDPELDERTGEPVQQLVVVMQTDLRDWEGVAKVPTDTDGVKLPGEKDTGRRAIYARKGTNIYSALGKAIFAAGAKDLEIGGKFGVQFFEEEDTGKGNPLKKFRAKYEVPVAKAAANDEWFDEDKPATKPAAASKKAAPKPDEATSPAGDEEPPF